MRLPFARWVPIVFLACSACPQTSQRLPSAAGSQAGPAVVFSALPPNGATSPGAPLVVVGSFVACPGALDMTLDGRVCEGDARCTWPNGRCECVTDYPCSGAERSPDEIARLPHVLRCSTTDAAVLRADGCPALGAPRGPCSRPGKICQYGRGCGGAWTRASCDQGAWRTEEGYTDPPP